MILVKICGITDPETAAFAVKEGAAFIGLIFEPSSHRYVNPEKAKELASQAKRLGAIPVGVFTTQNAKEIQAISEQVDWKLSSYMEKKPEWLILIYLPIIPVFMFSMLRLMGRFKMKT